MRLMLCLLALVPAPLLAQVRTAAQAHVWLSHFGDYAIGPRAALYQELFLRRAEEGRVWQQRHAAHGFTVTLSKQVRATAGHTYVVTSSYGELPAADDVQEHRAWAHATLAHATGRLQWAHRMRGEWRWIEAQPAWARTARWRQQVRLVYPLTPKAYLTGGAESFVRVHPAADRYALEQTRVLGGAGYTVAKATNLEIAYLQQRLRRAAEREHNHTLMLNVRATWMLR